MVLDVEVSNDWVVVSTGTDVGGISTSEVGIAVVSDMLNEKDDVRTREGCDVVAVVTNDVDSVGVSKTDVVSGTIISVVEMDIISLLLGPKVIGVEVNKALCDGEVVSKMNVSVLKEVTISLVNTVGVTGVGDVGVRVGVIVEVNIKTDVLSVSTKDVVGVGATTDDVVSGSSMSDVLDGATNVMVEVGVS